MTTAIAPQPKKTQALAPMSGERQDQFFDRASRALQKTIPSVNRRTIEILRIWKASPESAELNEKSELQFPDTDYTHFGPRCIFLEHTIPGGEEQEKIVYNKANLTKLVNWANHRIADSSTFAAISDGHTPSEEERAAGHAMPDVLGYGGPFYLGLLGDKEPKWAIYADEWVHNEDLPAFKKLQRRSPEVWCSEPMERRTMDPIAALGAETPRLDSGMNPYSRAGDGQKVMRYSAAGGPMVMPGPTNTFIPSGEKSRTVVDYSGDSKMDLPGAAPAKPDLGTIIAQAFQGLMPSLVQAINQGMSPDPVDNPDEPAPRGMEQDAPGGDAPDADGSDAPGGDAPAVPDDDDAKYKAMGPDCYAAYQAGRGAAKYSKTHGDKNVDVHAAFAKVQTQLMELKGENTKLRKEIENERRDVTRYSRLSQLGEDFSFPDGIDEEHALCKDMDDAMFERHCTKVVTRYAKRDDVTQFQIFDDPTVDVDKYTRGGNKVKVSEQQLERYSREAADRAVKKNGTGKKVTDFDTEYAAVLKEHGIAV